MKKNLTFILAILLTLSLVAGCGATSTSNSQTTAASPAPAASTPPTSTAAPETTQPAASPTSAFEAITVTDQLGRDVTIAKRPECLVSGYYISTSLLIALGLEDRLVGIEAKAAQRPIYALSAPQLLNLPNVGTAKDFSIEGTLALKPDLVILPARLKDAIETLSDMGLAVIAVNPEDAALLEASIALLGEATGTSDRALALVNRIAELETKVQGFVAQAQKNAQTPAKRVYLAGNSALLATAGSAMYQSALLETAGAINVAAELKDTYWAEISYEQLLAWQPDLIVLVPEASYTVADVLADPALADLAAVKNHQVYQMPREYEAWDSPVPSGILGQLYLTSLLYPDQYSDADFATDVADFYRDFYGF